MATWLDILLMETSQITVPTGTIPLTAGLITDMYGLLSLLWDAEYVKNPTIPFFL